MPFCSLQREKVADRLDETGLLTVASVWLLVEAFSNFQRWNIPSTERRAYSTPVAPPTGFLPQVLRAEEDFRLNANDTKGLPLNGDVFPVK